ncbi:response regulator transcription factor [Haliovirga abyssi]|uniref:Response regulatory protein n=1 Tax=Haliovirga abyssi TaxID=2996794 RepID=A0AAU9DJ30_9FUSO|nr:response regulator [Haliovirga abyssi]BDU51637.1 putative response regulatory protein [Haliovirga abyssi]
MSMIKIVVVEDEDIIRKGLIYTVDWLSMGCIVIGEAENGEEGVSKIKELKPDIIITDIKMPKKNGLEMIKELNEIYDFESIIISSYAEFKYAKEAIKLNVFDYLLKPIDEEKLEEIIEKVKLHIQDKKIYQEIKGQIKDIDQIQIIDIDYYIHSGNVQSKYTKETIEYIFKNYNSKITIDEMSDKLYISPSYLSRKFKEETGHTLNNFLNKYRIQKALELLFSGDYKVYEIAELVGFSNYKYFSSVFKKYIKCSPLEFVKNDHRVIDL